MSNSYQRVPSDGTMVLLDISIDYLDRDEITVYFDDVLTTAWIWSGTSDKRILFPSPVPTGVVVMVKRTTNASKLRHVFSEGAKFTAPNLDEDLKQALHMAQEASEANLVGDFFTDINMHGFRLYNIGPAVDDTDALTLGQARADSETAVGAATTAVAAASAAAASAASAAAAIQWTDTGAGANSISPGNWFSGFVHPASYGNNIVTAHAAAVSLGKQLLIPGGTYTINTNLDFTVPVVFLGGVLTGSGTVRFLKGLSAANYYWADINVALIQGVEYILSEWFGANAAGGTNAAVASKPWNTWPSWITDATFLQTPGHDYGNGTYLAANKPFTTADTVDFIGLQRALWAGGVPSTTTQGPSYVYLLGRQYKVNRQVTWTGQSAVGMRGSGQLSSTITSNNWTTHSTQGTAALGNAKELLRVYRGGPAPLDLESFGLLGPTGHVPSADGGTNGVVALLELVNTNGTVPKHMWFSACDAAILGGSNSSDTRAIQCMFEFCKDAYRANDGSWARFDSCSWWQSWAYTSKVANCPSAHIQIFGGQFVGYDDPLSVGAESFVQADWIDVAGSRRKLANTSLERTFTVPSGGSTVIVRTSMDPFSACRLRVCVGGVVQGVGEYGGEVVAQLSRGAGAITIATPTNVEWGNATAQTAVTITVTDGGSGVLVVTVACTGVFNGTAHVQLEGSTNRYKV